MKMLPVVGYGYFLESPIIFDSPQNSKQHYAPLYDYFFGNKNYFKQLKETYRPLLTSFTQLLGTSSI